jgi:hypothetical protein
MIDKAVSRFAEKQRKVAEYKESFARVLRKKIAPDYHPMILGDLAGQRKPPDRAQRSLWLMAPPPRCRTA